MSAGKINSNTVDAQEAISELTGISDVTSSQTVDFGSSDVGSMLVGKELANQLMNHVSQVVSCVLAQANKFPELASTIEERDMEAAKRWN